MPKNPSPEPASILDTVNMLDTMATDSSDSDSEVEPPLSIRLYSTKPRSVVQRRATITGASPTTKHGIDIEQFWKELKQEHRTTFRDKAASCAHGLDNVPSNIRPQTCLALESAKRRKKTDGQMDDKKVQFQEKLTDTENTHSDDARKTAQSVKERIIPTQNCDDSANVPIKNTNKEHSPVVDNVSDSNNLSDTTVPLDECNNFINDSISKNIPASKEIGIRKERGKLDKSYSTPAYDLSDNEDKEETRKITPLESLFCKLDLSIHCSNNIPSNSITKTDDDRKLEDANKEHKEISIRKCGGNVAQKISDIEKQIAHENAEEQVCHVFGVPKELEPRKSSARSTMSEVNPRNSINDRNQSNIECNLSDVNTYEKNHTARKQSIECENMHEHPDIIYPKDSTCEYHEEANCDNMETLNMNESAGSNSSSSNDSDEALQKFGEILQTVDCALTQHAKLLEKKSSIILSKEDSTDMKISSNNANSIENDLPDVINNISKNSTRSQIKEMKSADSSLAQATVQSCRYIELPKIESVKRFENKSHITPPEPPPRKYYTKHTATDLKLNNTPKMSENLEKPQVPERPSVRRELKKIDLNLSTNHVRNSSDCHDKKEFSDMCMLNYTENSMDFIDESRTASLNEQKFTHSDASLYNENNDKQSKEEKYPFEKYEPFVEKFACSGQSIADCYKSDHFARNIECPDGMIYSKQITSPDLRSKLSEKDKSFEKSVVNRAMMVARSIGLHGSLSKSNSSPRSSRKRNILLASKSDRVIIFFNIFICCNF